MLHYIVQVVLFQLIFLLVYEFLLKKETFFAYNRWYLLITPILALVLPLLKFETLGAWVPTENLVMLPVVILGETTETMVSQITSVSNSELFQMNWWLVAYFSGLLVSLGLFFKKYIGLKKMFRFKVVSQEKGFKIIEVPNSTVACTFFNSIFMGSELKPEEKQHVLAHEIVHVNQKHSWDLIFFEIFKIIFWFNPLIYIFQQKIAVLHEFMADAQVVKKIEKKTYYHQLLNTAFNTQNISFTNQFFNHSLIKKRIMMLQKSQSKRIAKYKYLLVLPLMLLMLIYVSCSGAKQRIATKSDAVEKILINEGLDKVSSSEVTKPSKTEIPDAIPYAVVDQVPIFPSCEDLSANEAKKECMSTKIRELVNTNFNIGGMKPYAEIGINKIAVQFKIASSGNIEDIEARTSSPQLEAEAIRVVSLLPQMVPGKKDGEAVDVLYTLPIIFKKVHE